MEKPVESLTGYEMVPLYVPFEDKDVIKEMGARWNPDQKQWVIAKSSANRFKQWLVPPKKKYISVPYEKRDDVKAAGGKWDKDARSWYFENTVPKEFKSFIKL